jgi:hypothetical protein
MLISYVISPDTLQEELFADKVHFLNVFSLLSGISGNGVVLVDAEGKIYDRLFELAEALSGKKGNRISILFTEEFVKKKKRKFVKCKPRIGNQMSMEDMVITLAMQCRPDSLIVASNDKSQELSNRKPPIFDGVAVTAISDYIESPTEELRRQLAESKLPALDTLNKSDAERLLIQAMRFSKCLRFYDAIIGKGTRCWAFREGIEHILKLWRNHAYFRDGLSVEVYTVADESERRKFEPFEAYEKLKREFELPLQRSIELPLKLFFKKKIDTHNKDHSENDVTHQRLLQTDYCILNFDHGFDILKPKRDLDPRKNKLVANEESIFRHMPVNLYPGGHQQLVKYRGLPNYDLS